MNEQKNASSLALMVLSLVSVGVYLLIAYLIFRFVRNAEMTGAFDHGLSLVNQLIIGGGIGLLVSGVNSFVSGRPPISEVLNDFYIVRELSKIDFNLFDRVQLSLFAGIGEELLFRAAIQPLLGVWVTSVLFIGAHGYFKFQNGGQVLFGIMMFALSVVLGFLYEYAGLLAAVSAHAVYDIVMLWWVKEKGKKYLSG